MSRVLNTGHNPNHHLTVKEMRINKINVVSNQDKTCLLLLLFFYFYFLFKVHFERGMKNCERKEKKKCFKQMTSNKNLNGVWFSWMC